MAKGKKSILKELIEIRGVKGVYETGLDGFLLGSIDTGIHDPEGVAAISAFNIQSSERIGNGLDLGKVRWVLLEYKHGKVIITKYDNKILTVITDTDFMLGDLLVKLNNSI